MTTDIPSGSQRARSGSPHHLRRQSQVGLVEHEKVRRYHQLSRCCHHLLVAARGRALGASERSARTGAA